MARRRRNGEGTYYYRADGLIEYKIYYTDEVGERKRKSFYGRSEDECCNKSNSFLEEQEVKNNGIDYRLTIPDILKAKYKHDFSMNYFSEAAYDRNLKTVAIIERSEIGKTPIIQITENQLEQFLKTITKYANRTIAKIYMNLKTAYIIAVDDGIVKKNIMNSRKLQRKPKSVKKDKEVKGFTEEEQRRFLETLEAYKVPKWKNDYKSQLLIELYTGMRMGEINALKVEDIDFDRGVINVSRTISKGLDGKSFVKETTKTKKGIREVPINGLVKPVLEEAILKAPKNRKGLLFYDKNKKSVITTEQVNSFFRSLLRKAKITDRGQHALRHTFATRCIEAGIPAVVLKDWMGHTNIHTTLDTYADVFSRLNNDAMKRFEFYIKSLK